MLVKGQEEPHFCTPVHNFQTCFFHHSIFNKNDQLENHLMKDRIQKIIDDKKLTPSRFADEVGLNRPAVSHILNGRNNPGLDALQRILSRYPDVNAGWLISGTGPMYNNESEEPIMPTLFDENEEFTPHSPEKNEYAKEMALSSPSKSPKRFDNQHINTVLETSVKVKKIAVFYSDNTYEEFVPSEKR
jgi:transcriptional regulator with XRE-family HTH domain